MNSHGFNILLMGLPESGKSTYIGALFHQLKAGTEDGLRLEGMPEERDYLIELESEWLSLKPLQRSQHHGPKHIEMTLLDEPSGRLLELVIPDIVGEDYEHAWEHGGWQENVLAFITSSEGVLLFIRADDVREARLIEVDESVEENSTHSDLSMWEPKDSPTQAKICDLLEQIELARDGDLPPIAILITAWDEVSGSGLGPSGWLEWKIPLLAQWLDGHGPELKFSVFGVSAQGGDVRLAEVRAQLARNAEERPLPDGADTLTAPIRWLMQQAGP